MIDWPSMPSDAAVLYEYEPAFVRMYIVTKDGGYRITMDNMLGASIAQPPLSKEKVIEIANKMIHYVGGIKTC